MEDQSPYNAIARRLADHHSIRVTDIQSLERDILNKERHKEEEILVHIDSFCHISLFFHISMSCNLT